MSKIIIKSVLIFLAFNGGICEIKAETVAASSGVYLNLHEDSMFYDSVVPFLIQFKIPKWRLPNLTVSRPECNYPEFLTGDPTKRSCASIQFIPEIQDRFTKFIVDNQPGEIGASNLPISFTNLEIPCGIIQKHFQSTTEIGNMRLSNATFEKYLMKLQDCSPVSTYNVSKIVDWYDQDLKTIYSNMTNNLKRDFLTISPRAFTATSAGVWANSVTATNALFYANLAMEINRWKMAFDDCSFGKTPRSLLTRYLHNNLILKDLESTLQNGSFECTFCGNLDYFKLSECFVTEDNKFVLRQLIPVVDIRRRESSQFHLATVKKAKYWNKGQICQLDFDDKTEFFLIDMSSKLAYNTNYKLNELCHIPSGTSKENLNNCISLLLNNETQILDIMAHCPLNCKTISPLIPHEISVEQMNSDTFLIGGIENVTHFPEILIKCPEIEDIFERPVDIGAIEVILPCPCRLYFSSVEYSPNQPCENVNTSAIIKRIVPLHWINKEIIGEMKMEDMEKLLDISVAKVTTEVDKNIVANQIQSGNEKLSLEQKSAFSTGESIFVICVILLLSICFIVMFIALIFKFKQLAYQVEELKRISSTAGNPLPVSFNKLKQKHEDI